MDVGGLDTRTTAQLLRHLRDARSVRQVARTLGGFVATATLALALGELYLRLTPPGELAQYLGADGPQTGPFRPDTRFGARYRSLDALAADNPGRFEPYRELLNHPAPQRVWAFFGSSFAQAPGMLADTTRALVPQRTEFHLGKNEVLPVRLAQAEFLLDAGLPVERLIIVVIPLDGCWFATHGLDQIRVTAGGGIAYQPRLPAVAASLIRASRLALKVWTSTGLHENRPWYVRSRVNTDFDGAPLRDFTETFRRFAATRARHGVPATVLLLPSYEQVMQGAGFAFQDAVAPELREQGYDVCDVRDAFLAYPNKPALFIPDKHFSAIGNRLLLAALIGHLKRTDPAASADLPDPDAVRP